ncbi:DUF4232 domain-containing protein [Streptomyces bullii]|uniref:DUF4232 domain-containing protein n=1 Tax=Streptomyces bullii TaxID=349910 RepID=A0ABW0UMW2_9ACTN
MRSLPIAVTASVAACLAATLMLTACADGGGSESKGTDKAADSACSIDEMGVRVAAAAAPAAGDTGTVTVTLTNRGDRCTLKGFPAAELVAGTSSATVPSDPAAEAPRLTLAENAVTAFTITYVRGGAGDGKSLAVKTVRLALPGTDGTHEFGWSYGGVALKGGAGEPDASVSAFQTAGD